jgi:hypothetical protein
MSEWKPVFKESKANLIIVGVILISSVLAIWSSRHISSRFTKETVQLNNELQQKISQLDTQQADVKNMQNHIARYEILRKQGLVGEPDRALWLEQIQESRKKLKLPETFAVELKAAKPIGASGDASGSQALQADPQQALWHDLHFEIRDVHEIDVLRLVQDFRERVKGRFRVHSCRMEEAKNTGLVAICTLRFVTIPAQLPTKITASMMIP